MKRNLTILIAILAAQLAALAQPRAFSIPERTEGASLVVEGKIVHQTSYWNKDRTKMFTSNFVQVSKVFKGEKTPQTVEIVTRGGFVGDEFQLLPHETEINAGEEGIFFLSPNDFNGHDKEAPTSRVYLGRQGVVRYVDMGGRLIAFDEFGAYTDVESLHQSIRLSSGQETRNLRPNSFEARSAPATSITSPTSGTENETEDEKTIEFTFENIELVDATELEFDIYASTNQESILFCGAEIYVLYNKEPFGQSLVANGNIEVTKGTIIQTANYTQTPSDYSEDILKVGITSDLGSTIGLYELSTQKEQLCHVKVDIQDLAALAYIGFDAFNMSGKSEYFDPVERACLEFDRILLDDPIDGIVPPQITLITPDTLPAGIDAILTIFGNNFGTYDTAFCRVKFRNADDPNATPWMEARKGDILDWQGNFIDVIVPSRAVGQLTAGEGKVIVINQMGSDTSGQTLDVPYSVITRRLNTPDREYRFELRRQLDIPFFASGIEFTLNDSILAKDALVDDIADDAIENWRCATEIAWSLSPSSSSLLTSAANDGINLIYTDAPSQFDPNDLAMTILTGQRFSQCGVGGVIHYVRDIDIAFKDDNSLFFYTLTGPIPLNRYDFYATLLHELGHAHMLDHAIPSSEKIMYPFVSTGDADRRTILADDITGGKAVIASSQNFLGSGLGCPEPINTNACGPTKTVEVKEGYTFEVYPNPFQENITVGLRLSEPQEVSLSIHDQYGRLVSFKGLGHLTSGESVFEIEMQDSLPAGFYIVQLRGEKGIKSTKILKF
jgi:hypothetical protein